MANNDDKAVFKSPMEIVRRKGNKKEVVLAAKHLTTAKEVRKVLPEEKYLSKLEEIIQRDFFPDIPKLRAQTEYTEALATNDVARIRALQMRYSTQRATEKRLESMTRRSPAPNRIGTDSTIVGGSLKRPDTGTSASEFDAADPPPGTSGEHKSSKKKTATHKGIDTTGLSVDRFLDKYTSEDNASFEDLCEVGARREKIDHRWMYDAAARHNKERVTFVENVALKGADEQILAKSLVSGETDSDTRPNQPDNYPIKARNEVLFFREEVPLTAEEQVRRAKMQEREVQSAHTRFKEAPFADESRKETLARAAMMQAALSKGHIDATGVELTTALGDAIVHVQQKFSNVVTPSPMPGVDESPLMTWGEIEGTPFRLDAGDMPVRTADLGGPSFRIPDVPLRDKLAHTVVDDISKVYHGKRKAAVEAATKAHPRTPKFGSARSMEHLASMSPAARRLATGKLGIKLSTDKALKASYTPNRRATPAGSTTPLFASPRATAAASPAQARLSAAQVTALINKRPKATDYFQ